MTHMKTSGEDYSNVVDAMLAGRQGFGNISESKVMEG